MNNIVIGKIGSIVTGICVLLFAFAMIFDLIGDGLFWCCFFCTILAIGFGLFMAGIISLNKDKHKSGAGFASLIFAAVYCVLICIVYFARCTTVNLHPELDETVKSIIDYGHVGSLFFNYDLLGYGFMALSTLFAGFLVDKSRKCAKPLSLMLKIHGVFFLPCFIVPMFPVFTAGSAESSIAGTILLLIWCAYFLPICFFGYRYFKN